MNRRRALVLTALLAFPVLARAGGRRYQPSHAGEPTPSPSPSPAHTWEKPMETLEQRIMDIGEMVEYFSALRPGTALRLTYANGAEYAGNFDGREPGRALIYCRNGLAGRRQVPLRRVMDAYIIESSSMTVRIHHKNFPWKDR